MSFETCYKTRISYCYICCHQTSCGVFTYGKKYLCFCCGNEIKFFCSHDITVCNTLYGQLPGIQASAPAKISKTFYNFYAVIHSNSIFQSNYIHPVCGIGIWHLYILLHYFHCQMCRLGTKPMHVCLFSQSSTYSVSSHALPSFLSCPICPILILFCVMGVFPRGVFL